jgi:hypothetical protein
VRALGVPGQPEDARGGQFVAAVGDRSSACARSSITTPAIRSAPLAARKTG